MSQTVELLRCWKDRWEERHVALAIGALVLAFVGGAALLIQTYSSPELLLAAALPR